jgi:hypothetical protein
MVGSELPKPAGFPRILPDTPADVPASVLCLTVEQVDACQAATVDS